MAGIRNKSITLIALAFAATSAHAEIDLASSFKSADKNKDGFISKSEMKKLRGMNKKNFVDADTNKDGKIDLEEYKAWYESKYSMDKTKPVEKDSSDCDKERVTRPKAAGEAAVTPPTTLQERSGTSEMLGDAAVTAKVKAALIKDAGLTGLEIHVDTNNGVVQLRGNVKNEVQLRRAEEIAKGVSGVKSVTNGLTVGK